MSTSGVGQERVLEHRADRARAHRRTRSVVRPDGGPGLSELERERAHRRVLQQQVTALTRRGEDIQDEERRRIGRDIHDGLGQQMTALRMQLELMYTQCSPALQAQIAKAQQLVRAVDQDLDELVARLRPAALRPVDFTDAMSGLVERASEQFGFAAECAVSSVAAQALSAEIAANLYAITQEALHNIVKHARAKSVCVSLSRSVDCAVLSIKDDGCGIQPVQEVRGRSGAGLTTMRERATLAGGHLQIESAPGFGTTISVRIPLAARNPQ